MFQTFEDALQSYSAQGITTWAKLSSQERRNVAALYLRTFDGLSLLEWWSEQPGLQLPTLVADVMEGKRNGVGAMACPHVTLATTLTLNTWHNVETLLALEWKALMKNQHGVTPTLGNDHANPAS